MKRIENLKKSLIKLGIFNTLVYIIKTKGLNPFRLINSEGKYKTGHLKSKELMFPIKFRYNSSDISVFYGVFVKNAYESIKTNTPPKLIIDCGANVGYSSAYFLSKYPMAKVIAVEPDLGNFEIMKENLSPYGNRVKCLCSAVWSRPTKLKVENTKAGEWKEWSTKVRECTETEKADLKAVDISTLLKESGFDQIDILKVDIEGSEAEVFAENYENWLDKVSIIAIELHSANCHDIFNRALSSGDYMLRREGELTIANRLKA